MKTVFVLTALLLGTSVSFAQDRVGYKLNGEVVKEKKDVLEFIAELNKLKSDEDYEVNIDLCVVYDDLNVSAEDDLLDIILASEGFSMELEGIYGDDGNHMFEIYSHPEGEYLGAFTGVYSCE